MPVHVRVIPESIVMLPRIVRVSVPANVTVPLVPGAPNVKSVQAATVEAASCVTVYAVALEAPSKTTLS